MAPPLPTTSDDTAAPEPEDDFNARFWGVWFFVLDRVNRWHAQLSAQERVNYTVDDTLHEVWIECRIKDCKFDPGKAKYITFVGTLLSHKLMDLRDTARTVHGPTNSASRIKQYLEALRLAEAGQGPPPSAQRGRNIGQILASQGGYVSLSSGSTGLGARGESPSDPGPCCDPSGREPTPEDSAESDELLRAALGAVSRAVSDLAPYEALVIGQRYGLWGQDALGWPEIAARLRREIRWVKAVAAAAEAKIRERIERGFTEL